jgi:hypothetical protein
MMNDSECHCVIEQLLSKPFSSHSFIEKKELLAKGRPTPPLPDLCRERKTGGKIVKLRFHPSKYDDIPWLCGCSKLSKLFCWPCLLFSTRKTVWNSGGIDDLNNLGNVLKQRHQQSKEHLDAYISFKTFIRTENRIEFSLSRAHKENIEKHNNMVKCNRYVVKKLIDVTCFLALQELPFRGHNESESSVNRGNYRELLQYTAQNDSQLQMHLQNSTVFSGETASIQNDLIDACSQHLIVSIKKEIQNTQFVAIIVDETTDIAKKSQLSIVFRYLDDRGIVQERFIRFLNVSDDRTADRISKCVFDHLDEFQCHNKLVAQTYDGASVNTGQYNGLAAQVKSKCPQALFTICYAHKLNLVLLNSSKNIKQCKIFFMTLSGFSSFFSHSSKRSHTLDEIVRARFPSVAPTRWQYNNRLVEMVYNHKDDLTKLFNFILENDINFDAETKYCAKGFLKNLNDFEFNFLLEIFHCVLPKAEILFKILQTKSCDIMFCDGEVQNLKKFLAGMREDFESLWVKMKDFESNHNATRSKKRMKIDNNETSYRRLYYEIIDNLIVNIEDRFSDFKKLNFFALLDFNKFGQYSSKFPAEHLTSLMKSNYGQYFNEAMLNQELNYVYSNETFCQKSVSQLNDYLISNDISDAFPELTKLVRLFLTIPATSASAERSFSALKRIKSYARNTTAQDRLNGLSIISIEKQMFRDLKKEPGFYDSVIDIFAGKKERRIDLKYK